MDKFIHHIEQLLAQHDCVIIPDFGGFIVNHVSAVIDNANGTIKAPQKVIYFNPALNYNDGLLVGAILTANHTTFRKANRMVADQVTALRQSIQQGNTVEMGKIGSFALNTQGQIEFMPAASFDFLPDNIGNYPIHFNTLRSEQVEKRQIVLQLPSNGHRLYKYVAACAAVMILMMAAPALQHNVSSNFAKINPLSIFDSQSTHTAVVQESHVVAALPAKQILTPTQTPVALISSPAQINNGIWHVIVGNFETPKSARKYIDLIAKTDKTPLTAYGTNNVYRIVAGSFVTKAEAVEKQKELQQHPDFKTAWLLNNPKLQSYPLASETTTNEPIGKVTADVNGSDWHLVVANFKTTTCAQKFIDEVGKKDKTPLSVYGTNNMYRVVVGSFTSKEAAIEKKKQIQQHNSFKDAWVLYKPASKKS